MLKGILPYAKSRPLFSEYLSPHFGDIAGVKVDIAGVKVHAKSGFAEDLQERKERLSDRKCSHEEANQDLKRTSEVLGASGRFPLSESFLVSGMRMPGGFP